MQQEPSGWAPRQRPGVSYWVLVMWANATIIAIIGGAIWGIIAAA